MTIWLGIAIGGLLLASVLAAWRALSPCRLADRAVAFDVLTSLITSGLLLWSAATGETLLLEVALVLGLLGFLTSVTVARFIERSGG